MSHENPDHARLTHALQRSLAEQVEEFHNLPEEERQRLGREHCARLGFSPDDILKMVASIGALGEDPTALASVCQAACERLLGTRWESAMYANIMSNPTVLVSVVVQAAVGGFLLGSGQAPEFQPEILETAGLRDKDEAMHARMVWVDVVTRGLRALVLERALEHGGEDEPPKDLVH